MLHLADIASRNTLSILAHSRWWWVVGALRLADTNSPTRQAFLPTAKCGSWCPPSLLSQVVVGALHLAGNASLASALEGTFQFSKPFIIVGPFNGACERAGRECVRRDPLRWGWTGPEAAGVLGCLRCAALR